LFELWPNGVTRRDDHTPARESMPSHYVCANVCASLFAHVE
jgi:hypothetical protein